jgi:hypothetical protein
MKLKNSCCTVVRKSWSIFGVVYALTTPSIAFSEDVFRNLTAPEKSELSANISSRCSLIYKQQTTKISDKNIQDICSCTAHEMVTLLVPYDILEENTKNKDRVVDPGTNFRKIQYLASLKCTEKFLKN